MPLSNMVTEDGNDFVCVGENAPETREIEQDRFTHCFKSEGGTDSIYNYDEYDIKSVLAIMSNALLADELKSQE